VRTRLLELSFVQSRRLKMDDFAQNWPFKNRTFSPAAARQHALTDHYHSCHGD